MPRKTPHEMATGVSIQIRPFRDLIQVDITGDHIPFLPTLYLTAEDAKALGNSLTMMGRLALAGLTDSQPRTVRGGKSLDQLTQTADWRFVD